MSIIYALEPDLSVQEFRAVLIASTLAQRRPVDDPARLQRMLRGADIIATARDGARLVGVARALSDFAYCCYLSDLAVDAAYQRQGIGRQLIRATHSAAGDHSALILIAAPAAQAYYPRIGMQPVHACWQIPRRG
jgi:GNAT superfamily N-acetyltransferase